MFGTLDQVDKRSISMGEHRVDVRVWNNLSENAPTAVLLHGAVVSSLYMLPLAHEMSSDFNVYVPELPGQGSSPRPKEGLNTMQRGGLLAALLDRLDLHDVTMVASSYGSQVATEALITDSSRVSSLLLVGPTVDDSAAAPLPQMARTIVGLPFEAWWFTPLAVFDLFRFGVFRTFGMARELAKHNMVERIQQIDVPVKVVRGAQDKVCPEPWAQRLADQLSTELTTVPDAGHTTHTRAPKAIAEEARKLTRLARERNRLATPDTFAS